jgi:hypothetical protein
VARMGQETIRKTGHRWENGIKMDLAVGCGVHSTGSGQGPVTVCCECGDEPPSSGARVSYIIEFGGRGV